MSINGNTSIPLTKTEIETEIHAKTETKRKREYTKRKRNENGNTHKVKNYVQKYNKALPQHWFQLKSSTKDDIVPKCTH